MTTAALKVSVEALSLPREARAELAQRLLVSLEDETLDSHAEKTWKAEIRRRRREIREGRAKLIPAEEAVRNALQAVS